VARSQARGSPRVDTQELNPTEIRAATRSVLDDPAYQAAARQLQREISALPDINAAAAVVERAVT
jgi:UDP:flavonoid glycosyltransferase YjiC (YdhE family)